MPRWNRSTQLAFVVIGSLAASAAAQPAGPPTQQATPQQIASARAHFETAEAAKQSGDYKTAVAEYLAAHALYPDPEFFFDVGEVYRLAGGDADALTYYQKYLKLDPNGRGAAAAHAAVDQLRRSIAARRSAAKRAGEGDASGEGADDAQRAGDDAAGRGASATAPEAPPAAPAARAWYRDPIAVALLGTGVAAVGVGTGFLLSAQSADHDARTSASYQGVLDARDRASQRATIGSITGGAGIALVGGGLAWIFLHRDSREPRTVTGWIAPGGGGLAITSAF
jgi:tetratricopeptide (TPR) repeat protein